MMKLLRIVAASGAVVLLISFVASQINKHMDHVDEEQMLMDNRDAAKVPAPPAFVKNALLTKPKLQTQSKTKPNLTKTKQKLRLKNKKQTSRAQLKSGKVRVVKTSKKQITTVPTVPKKHWVSDLGRARIDAYKKTEKFKDPDCSQINCPRGKGVSLVGIVLEPERVGSASQPLMDGELRRGDAYRTPFIHVK